MAGWNLNGDELFKNSTTPATVFSLLSYVIAVVIIIVVLDVIRKFVLRHSCCHPAVHEAFIGRADGELEP